MVTREKVTRVPCTNHLISLDGTVHETNSMGAIRYATPASELLNDVFKLLKLSYFIYMVMFDRANWKKNIQIK